MIVSRIVTSILTLLKSSLYGPNDGTKATKAAWFLKAKQLPDPYWRVMIEGHEWMAKPARRLV
jgi:hypothetical protein